MNILNQVVTVSEMAEALGVSVQYIRAECQKFIDGKPSRVKCRKSSDGIWLILKSSVTESSK